MKMKKNGLFFSLLLFLSTIGITAHVDFRDNQVHEIDYEIHDFVRVDYNSPETITQLNLRMNGMVEGLSGCNNSIINIFGGEVLGNLDANDSTALSVYNGLVVGVLEARDQSIVVIDNIQLERQLRSYENSEIYVYGGVFLDTIVAGYGQGTHASTIYIYGNSFIVNGIDLTSGGVVKDYAIPVLDYLGRSCLGGNIVGTLSNGETLNVFFEIHDDAQIILIPEPMTLLLLGIGGLLIRKR